MSTNNSTKFFLSFDDLGYLLPGIDVLHKLKDTYSNFKVTCFTIPLPKQLLIKENIKHFKQEGYERWAKIINSYDWLTVGIHGMFHTKKEMDIGYDEAIDIIKAAENTFKRIGLKYKKIFKAPYWQYSWWALKALRDRGYTIALDRNNPIKVPKGTKTYYYNWSIEEPLPDKEIIYGHGHMFRGGVSNDIDSCFGNLQKQIPTNAIFI